MLYAVKAAVDAKHMREIRALSKIHHPNLVRYFYCWKDVVGKLSDNFVQVDEVDFVFIQMEFCEGGSLRTALKRRSFNGNTELA